MQATPGFLVGGVSDAPFIVAADVNGDGLSDVVMPGVGLGNSGSIAILLGQKNGTLSAAQYVAVPQIPDDLAVGDVDGNGTADLISITSDTRDAKPDLLYVASDSSFHTLINQGNAQFTDQPTVGLSGITGLASVIDFNLDGIPDLTVQVSQLQREIRTTSYLLHPPLLDECGLASALSMYVEGLAERSHVAITLDVAANVGRLPRDMELAVFRLVQECLTNIHRHSGSKTALIRVAREGESVRTEVWDYGNGMSPGRLLEIQSHGSGVGIRGIRERIRQFHGEMKIESNGSGTSVIVSIPMPKEVRSTDC
jgi:signal transduction histidine kinase